MSLAATLQTALEQITERIAELTASQNPTYTVGGRTVNKGEYLEQLIRSQKELLSQIQAADVAENGPWEVRSFGV